VLLDLWSKSTVFAWLGDPATHASLPIDAHGYSREPVAGEWLALMLNLNYGAAFGRLAGIPHALVIGRLLAVGLLCWLILRAPSGQRIYLVALVLILAGATGNLYDNFFFHPGPADIPRPQSGKPFGPVRDFIDVYFPGFDRHFPTFNVADSCITVGAVLLLLSGFAPRSNATPAVQ
jgi:signal peptidase II